MGPVANISLDVTQLQHTFELVWESPPQLRMLVDPHAGAILLANGALQEFLSQEDKVFSPQLLCLFSDTSLTSIQRVLQDLVRGQKPQPLRAQLRARPQAVRFDVHRLAAGSDLSLWLGTPIADTLNSADGPHPAPDRHADALVSRTLNVLAHDLQAPARIVASYSDLLHQRLPEDAGKACKRYVQHLLAAARRIQCQASGLAALSRASRSTAARTAVALDRILSAARCDLELPLAQANATFALPTLPTVHGDAGLLLQLWSQLLDNAVRYRSERPLHIEIRARRKADRWHLTMSDNGCGFRDEDGQHIFDVFKRLPCPQNADRPGIGLAIARQVVAAHRGHIWAQGQPGRGAAIHFDLPATASQTLAASSLHSTPSDDTAAPVAPL